MKKIILIATVLFSTFLSTSAQDNQAKGPFNDFLKSYFETKNALAKDKVEEASTGAKNLLSSVEKFPVKSLTPAQQSLWNTEAEVIRKASKEIVADKALKGQRQHFWAVSTATLKLTKTLNLNSTEVYVQHCPMAKKSWLNEVQPVQNPFYGSMMYDCGEVTETLSKK